MVLPVALCAYFFPPLARPRLNFHKKRLRLFLSKEKRMQQTESRLGQRGQMMAQSCESEESDLLGMCKVCAVLWYVFVLSCLISFACVFDGLCLFVCLL